MHDLHSAPQPPGAAVWAPAGSAGCPVAVIRQPEMGRCADAGRLVAEADAPPENNVVLGWAMAAARLRGASPQVITAGQSQPGDMVFDSSARRIYHGTGGARPGRDTPVTAFERTGFG